MNNKPRRCGPRSKNAVPRADVFTHARICTRFIHSALEFFLMRSLNDEIVVKNGIFEYNGDICLLRAACYFAGYLIIKIQYTTKTAAHLP